MSKAARPSENAEYLVQYLLLVAVAVSQCVSTDVGS